jgi:hypothetical protein
MASTKAERRKPGVLVRPFLEWFDRMNAGIRGATAKAAARGRPKRAEEWGDLVRR